jgi:hypothetical protein
MKKVSKKSSPVKQFAEKAVGPVFFASLTASALFLTFPVYSNASTIDKCMLNFQTERLSEADLIIVDRMTAIRNAMVASKGDHYTILGVLSDAKDDDIRKGFRKLASPYHPDRMTTKPESIRALADEISGLIGQSYAVLGDPGKRMAYDQSLLRNTSSGADVGSPKKASKVSDFADLSADNRPADKRDEGDAARRDRNAREMRAKYSVGMDKDTWDGIKVILSPLAKYASPVKIEVLQGLFRHNMTDFVEVRLFLVGELAISSSPLSPYAIELMGTKASFPEFKKFLLDIAAKEMVAGGVKTQLNPALRAMGVSFESVPEFKVVLVDLFKLRTSAVSAEWVEELTVEVVKAIGKGIERRQEAQDLLKRYIRLSQDQDSASVALARGILRKANIPE